MSDSFPNPQPAPDTTPDTTPDTVLGPDEPAPACAPAVPDAQLAVLKGIRLLVLTGVALFVAASLAAGMLATQMTSQVTALEGKVAVISAQLDAAALSALAAPTQPAAPAEAVALQPAKALEGVADMPARADTGGAITVGDPNAENIVEVFSDFQCPYCQKWEAEVGADLVARALKPGSNLQVRQYNEAFLLEENPELDPAGASARAANAAVCVAEFDGTEAYVALSQAIFAAADPNEPAGQFPLKQLLKLATAAGASEESLACIEAERFVPFVAATTQSGFARGVQGTPTVSLNGTKVENPFTGPELLALLAP